MSAHTPGPWAWEYSNDVGPDDDYFIEFFEITSEDGREIARVEEKEDARLMAAAPELLEALQTILNISLMDKGHWAKTIEQTAHKAIAKATGETK